MNASMPAPIVCSGCGLASVWYVVPFVDERYHGRCPSCGRRLDAEQPVSGRPGSARARAIVRAKIEAEQIRPMAEAYRPLTDDEIERLIDYELRDV